MKSYKENLKNITTLIFDVDGVLTNGKVIVFNGEFLRSIHSKDAFAIQYAAKLGYNLFIITGGYSKDLNEKLISLGVKEVFSKSSNKLEIYTDLKEKYKFIDDETLYIGDDLPDYPIMKLVKIATCPADAVPEIKAISHYHSPFFGGETCVRDVIEQVLKVQENWMKEEAFMW
jgi:3-deoxy-D-manno-octulosonate 8-phosphate phosphatase (KDO 8-P phosphatase)